MASTSGLEEDIEYVELEPGPVDDSVLYLQPNHRTSNDAWMKREDPDFTIDHSISLKKVRTDNPRVLQQIQRAGFSTVMSLGYMQLDHHLITALVDRWRPETSGFHLRVGEMTITLGDVAVLLGLPIQGYPLVYDAQHDYVQMCIDLLGIIPPPAQLKGRDMVEVKWFRQALAEDLPVDATDEEVEQRARAIILHIITSRLMCDHSKNRVDLKWLPYLADLDRCAQYSWGSAVLCYTYMELSALSLLSTKLIGGCLTLVQLWSWTYLPVGRIEVRNVRTDHTKPLGDWWIGPKKTTTTPRCNVKFYRNEFDVLDSDSVIWTPYTEDTLQQLPVVCTAARHLWTARVPLVCNIWTAYHLPDRVMRQFGMSQHIPEPAPVYTGEYSAEDVDTAIQLWNHNHAYIQIERQPIISIESYMRWYWNITRRYVLKAPVEAVRRDPYTPRAPLERNVADGIYKALQSAEQLELRLDHDAESKAMCCSIKSILRSVLGRNKLERPRQPSPPPPPPPADMPLLTYTRRNRRGESSSFQDAGPSQEEVDVGPSQPRCTMDEITQIEEEEYISQATPRRVRRTPLELRRLRP